ncbi:hypothetical protein [Sphingomonas sp. PvP018]|uniref:hypothetical protein n=1 Tax=Sphingomonas sp. PvP018 TaxID=2817852 RepID=UPI001AE7D4F0|nr:hypothetical protein [Sphingomonas sp. PvP018]MBP2512661.1 hypothetical protein [Sphingomonas sp. PvP018]
MKIFDNLAAMRACLPEGACVPTEQVLTDMEDYIDGPIEQASFTHLFGAPAYLIEQVEDLSAVLSFDEVDGRRLSLADAASSAFDVAEWVDEGRFARFVTIETADGGSQYLVPRHVAERVSFVCTSVEMRFVDHVD